MNVIHFAFDLFWASFAFKWRPSQSRWSRSSAVLLCTGKKPHRTVVNVCDGFVRLKRSVRHIQNVHLVNATKHTLKNTRCLATLKTCSLFSFQVLQEDKRNHLSSPAHRPTEYNATTQAELARRSCGPQRSNWIETAVALEKHVHLKPCSLFDVCKIAQRSAPGSKSQILHCLPTDALLHLLLLLYTWGAPVTLRLPLRRDAAPNRWASPLPCRSACTLSFRR